MNNKLDGILVRGFTAFVIRFSFFFFVKSDKMSNVVARKKKSEGKKKSRQKEREMRVNIK